jgi:hypothetical protein
MPCNWWSVHRPSIWPSGWATESPFFCRSRSRDRSTRPCSLSSQMRCRHRSSPPASQNRNKDTSPASTSPTSTMKKCRYDRYPFGPVFQDQNYRASLHSRAPRPCHYWGSWAIRLKGSKVTPHLSGWPCRPSAVARLSRFTRALSGPSSQLWQGPWPWDWSRRRCPQLALSESIIKLELFNCLWQETPFGTGHDRFGINFIVVYRDWYYLYPPVRYWGKDVNLSFLTCFLGRFILIYKKARKNLWFYA